MGKQEDVDYTKLKLSYKQLLVDYNTLVREHNNLVDKHNKLTADANAILHYVEDIGRGLRIYITEETPSREKVVQLTPLQVRKDQIFDVGRNFTLAVYNGIVEFLTNIRKGKTPAEAYKLWMDSCLKASQITIKEE